MNGLRNMFLDFINLLGENNFNYISFLEEHADSYNLLNSILNYVSIVLFTLLFFLSFDSGSIVIKFITGVIVISMVYTFRWSTSHIIIDKKLKKLRNSIKLINFLISMTFILFFGILLVSGICKHVSNIDMQVGNLIGIIIGFLILFLIIDFIYIFAPKYKEKAIKIKNNEKLGSITYIYLFTSIISCIGIIMSTIFKFHSIVIFKIHTIYIIFFIDFLLSFICVFTGVVFYMGYKNDILQKDNINTNNIAFEVALLLVTLLFTFIKSIKLF